MPNNPPLINGRTYSWGDVKLNIMGVAVAGITKISYKDEQEMEDNFGAGNMPVNRGFGNTTSTASITLYSEEVMALEDVAPNGRIQEIPEFDIVVSYVHPNGLFRTNILKNVRFKSNGRETETGSTKIEVEIPLQISHIIWKP